MKNTDRMFWNESKERKDDEERRFTSRRNHNYEMTYTPSSWTLHCLIVIVVICVREIEPSSIPFHSDIFSTLSRSLSSTGSRAQTIWAVLCLFSLSWFLPFLSSWHCALSTQQTFYNRHFGNVDYLFWQRYSNFQSWSFTKESWTYVTKAFCFFIFSLRELWKVSPEVLGNRWIKGLVFSLISIINKCPSLPEKIWEFLEFMKIATDIFWLRRKKSIKLAPINWSAWTYQWKFSTRNFSETIY